MRRFLLMSAFAAIGVVVATPAFSREIRDPEAKFKIKIPDTWSAMSQSSRDGASIFWAFLSPKENFRIIMRVLRQNDRRACKEILAAYEASELRGRMSDYKEIPQDAADQKEMTKDHCGGMYVGSRMTGDKVRRPYVVFLDIQRVGEVVFFKLGESEHENFEKRATEFIAAWDSIQVLK